jgi:hypothetical protein
VDSRGDRDADAATLTEWPSYHWGSEGHTSTQLVRGSQIREAGCYADAMSFHSAVVRRGHGTLYVRLHTNIYKVGACDGAHPFLATDGSGPLPGPSVAFSVTYGPERAGGAR